MTRLGGRRRSGDQLERARRRLAALEATKADHPGEVILEADPAGAANLMREAVAEGVLDVRLEEHAGCWQVAVRIGETLGPVLAEVLDLVARCAERGLIGYARLGVGPRTYTVYSPDLAPTSAVRPGRTE